MEGERRVWQKAFRINIRQFICVNIFATVENFENFVRRCKIFCEGTKYVRNLYLDYDRR